MIVVKVELHSAVTGKVEELARMLIANKGDSTSPSKGNYKCLTLRGRSKEALDKATVNGTVTRRGEVMQHARLSLHVWHLVAKALKSMNYGEGA